jgi:hypothetical protein
MFVCHAFTSLQLFPLPWWEGTEGRGWFDKLTMITLSMSKGHPHPHALPSRERVIYHCLLKLQKNTLWGKEEPLSPKGIFLPKYSSNNLS